MDNLLLMMIAYFSGVIWLVCALIRLFRWDFMAAFAMMYFGVIIIMLADTYWSKYLQAVPT